MKDVYIAGPVSGLSAKEIQQFRDIIKDILEIHGLTYIDPLDGFNLNNPDYYLPEEIVISNQCRIKNSRVVLADFSNNISAKSLGMLGELVFAKCNDKITVGFGDTRNVEHPWFNKNIDLFYETADEACLVISRLLEVQNVYR